MRDRQKILIVDDKPENLYTLEMVLREIDAEIIKAESGNEALTSSLSHEFALAVVDVQMPEMDGYELAELLRSEERTERLPIIFLSAVYSDEFHVFRGYEAGGVDFIIKPYRPEILVGKVRVFLQLDRYARELRKAHDEMEQRVEERTAELARANETLKAEIAERMKAEAAIRESEQALMCYARKLEQSNRELESFAFVASHDLQEPLRKIRTFTDRIKTAYGESLGAKGLDYLEKIRSCSRRMQDLILDLLKYSRVTGSTQPFASTSLEDAVLDVVMDLKLLFEETGGEIVIGKLPGIEADPVQMRQLFWNLLTNALKYRGEHRPQIHVCFNPSCTEGYVEVQVKDNGIGFDECFLDKIFEPFQRLHGRKSAYQGTGMGLAISRRIVERHGGSITARGEPGKGATFIVRLPVRQQKLESTHEQD